MSRSLTPATSLDNLRKEARRGMTCLRHGDPEARARWRLVHAEGRRPRGLRDVQHAIAREYGFATWAQLNQALAERSREAAP
jgi:uncharacterized protein